MLLRPGFMAGYGCNPFMHSRLSPVIKRRSAGDGGRIFQRDLYRVESCGGIFFVGQSVNSLCWLDFFPDISRNFASYSAEWQSKKCDLKGCKWANLTNL